MEQIKICQFPCSCHFCETKIGKGEHLLEIYKQARRGVAKINLCAKCICDNAKKIPKKDVKAIENRLVEKEDYIHTERKCLDCVEETLKWH